MKREKLTAAEKAYYDWEHKNMHFVTKMEIVAPYTLHLTFDDGKEKTIDFREYVFHPYAGPEVEKMQDPDYFNKVVLLDGHPTWVWEDDPAPFPRGWDFHPPLLYTWDGKSWRDYLRLPEEKVKA